MKMIGREFILSNRNFSDKSLIFSVVSQILLMAGFITLLASMTCASTDLSTIAFELFSISLAIFFVLSPIFAIIGNLMLFCKTRKTKVAAILVLELALLVIMGPRCLPYLYASPALSPKKVDAYTKFIKFCAEDDRHPSILWHRDHFLINGNRYIMTPPEQGLRDIFSDSEIDNLESIDHELNKIGCQGVQRKGNWIYSYRINTPSRPRSIGVLYSISGENPNESNDIALDRLGPFIAIDGNWYTSEKLTKYARTAMLLPVPRKSLLDHSLKIANKQDN